MQRTFNHPSSSPISLTPQTSLKIALWLLKETTANALPVMENGRYLGVVLREDLLLYAPSPANGLTQWEMPELLERVSIADERLIRQIPKLPHDASSSRILQAMDQAGVVAVVRGNTLLRLITWRDVLNDLSNGASYS